MLNLIQLINMVKKYSNINTLIDHNEFLEILHELINKYMQKIQLLNQTKKKKMKLQ